MICPRVGNLYSLLCRNFNKQVALTALLLISIETFRRAVTFPLTEASKLLIGSLLFASIFANFSKGMF